MSVLGKEELFARIQERIGDDTSDDTIRFIEDVTDTYNDLEQRSTPPQGWEAKYNALDEQWRKRYTERFFSDSLEAGTTPAVVLQKQIEDVKEDSEQKDFKDLFKEREE